ncbi:O-antigen ligase family protein [Guptibacillus hwajinpoensis]|uniref:O-antigen ligase family protein n=1 Tax=Guptibacillus hwajinpoensis TaxID=208199 RepID=UPI003D08D4F4
MNYFFVFSLIHVLATLFQFLKPNLMSNVNSIILSGQNLVSNQELLNLGSYAGITGQTGINSLYISIFIAVVFSKLLNKPQGKKIIILILLSVGFLALLLTVKRSQVIVNLISMMIVLFVFINNDKKKTAFFVSIPVLISGLGFIIIKTIPRADAVFDKFAFFSEQSDFTNGREYLWNTSLEIFAQNPLFGVGAATIIKHIQDMSHNIYIQLLAEMGVLGFTVFILGVLISFVITIRETKKYIKNDKTQYHTKMHLGFSIYMQTYFLLYGFFGNPLYGIVFLATYMQSIALGKSYFSKDSRN